jgi:hypothetical protein
LKVGRSLYFVHVVHSLDKHLPRADKEIDITEDEGTSLLGKPSRTVMATQPYLVQAKSIEYIASIIYVAVSIIWLNMYMGVVSIELEAMMDVPNKDTRT